MSANVNEKPPRLIYIDFFRSFGIMLMIMGHIGFGSLFDKYIHFFHMPMFFILSGFFFKEQTFSKLSSRKFRTLIVPYLFFGVFHCLIYFVINRGFDIHALYLLFFVNTADKGIPIAGALWFLTAMFFSEIMFWCIQKVKSYVFSMFLVVSISLIGMSLPFFFNIRLPLAIDVAMVGVGFYYAGKTIKKHMDKLRLIHPAFVFLGIIVFSVSGLLNDNVNLRTGHFGIWPLFWINSIGMTISLLLFFYLLQKWIEKYKTFLAVKLWIISVGRDSIVFLCLNQICIMIMRSLISLVFRNTSGMLFLLVKFQIFILVMVMLSLARKLIVGSRLKAVLGK